jgi:hypothetical protein
MRGTGLSNSFGGNSTVQGLKSNFNNSLKSFWSHIDNRFMVPFFGGAGYENVPNGDKDVDSYGAIDREDSREQLA